MGQKLTHRKSGRNVEEMEKPGRSVDRPENTRKHLNKTGGDWNKTEQDKRLEED